MEEGMDGLVTNMHWGLDETSPQLQSRPESLLEIGLATAVIQTWPCS